MSLPNKRVKYGKGVSLKQRFQFDRRTTEPSRVIKRVWALRKGARCAWEPDGRGRRKKCREAVRQSGLTPAGIALGGDLRPRERRTGRRRPASCWRRSRWLLGRRQWCRLGAAASCRGRGRARGRCRAHGYGRLDFLDRGDGPGRDGFGPRDGFGYPLWLRQIGGHRRRWRGGECYGLLGFVGWAPGCGKLKHPICAPIRVRMKDNVVRLQTSTCPNDSYSSSAHPGVLPEVRYLWHNRIVPPKSPCLVHGIRVELSGSAQCVHVQSVTCPQR